MLVISCHADTNFGCHQLERIEGGLYHGFLDNFVGVHAVMRAYFSGRIDQDHVRIELTYGEERDFAGAIEVLETLRRRDTVLVVDVTATPTRKSLVIEKCDHPLLQGFLAEALEGISYDMYEDCPDPISEHDETDVYADGRRLCCFLGIPVWGGNYNEDAVFCRQRSVRAMSEAICRIAENYPGFCETIGIRPD